ncbi:hypothetical protein [Nitrosospira sp. NRS527]|uniref:hypothetical protein n=1 Tax=Nitrosospira sp. NRS527 TaxID=155925 RepID=UPI001AF17845|nr:hypothetical protein [Nitrosospira sp. NRS527]BCT69237.1 hypothetical protein NNRS527_02852 [Nitrosospira sp. NRS527]
MKEIAVTGGITAHCGYLITKALFAAKPVTRRSFAYAHIKLAREYRLYLGIPCAMRWDTTPAITPDMSWLIFQQDKSLDFIIAPGVKYMPAILSASSHTKGLSIIGEN